jgi:NADPH:quinone reductase-like Zn-dependent oxidoreductase
MVRGCLKPVITEVVPFDAQPLQQAFEAFLQGANNVGKVIVRCMST